jgi:hypothetical protein
MTTTAGQVLARVAGRRVLTPLIYLSIGRSHILACISAKLVLHFGGYASLGWLGRLR